MYQFARAVALQHVKRSICIEILEQHLKGVCESITRLVMFAYSVQKATGAERSRFACGRCSRKAGLKSGDSIFQILRTSILVCRPREVRIVSILHTSVHPS